MGFLVSAICKRLYFFYVCRLILDRLVGDALWVASE